MEWCPHEEDPAVCPPCRRAAGKDRPAEPEAPSRVFEAKFPGYCWACHLPVHVGQRITMQDGQARHEGCQ